MAAQPSPLPSAGRLRRAAPLLALLLLFAASRALVWRQGVRSAPGLPRMHALDRDLLTHDLARSLFFLHMQPPALNAALGLASKLGGARLATVLSLGYWMLGLALALAMHVLLRRLGAGAWTAALATAAYVVSSTCLLYETFTSHDYPAAMLVAAATLAALRWWESGSALDGAAAASLVAAAALTRSLFHLVWVVAAVALLAALQRRPLTRRSTAALLAPVAVVVALYLENLAFFGTFGASTMLGLSLYRVAIAPVPRAERAARVAAGVLSPYALAKVNQPITAYATLPRSGAPRVALAAPRDVPALDRVLKRDGGANLNHRAMPAVMRAFARDALRLVVRDPGRYLRSVGRAALIFLAPPTDHPAFRARRRRIGAWDRATCLLL